MGNPLLANRRSERENTKGSTGKMHGLKMVSTPPKKTNAAKAMKTVSLPTPTKVTNRPVSFGNSIRFRFQYRTGTAANKFHEKVIFDGK
jgi:hypothetical protein